MQQKPIRWNDEQPVRVFAQLDERSWPNRDASLPGGFVEAGSFQIQRDLTGGGLPGSARGGSGLSVGSGSVSLPQTTSTTVSPFGSRLVRAGGSCKLWAFSGDERPTPVSPSQLKGWALQQATEAAAARPADPVAPMSADSGMQMAAMTTHTVSGSGSSAEVSLSVAETVPGMQRTFTSDLAATASNGTFDASYVIAEAARIAGFRPYQVPPTRGDSWSLVMSGYAMSASLLGSTIPRVGSLTSATSPAWSNRDGVQWYTGGALRYALEDNDNAVSVDRRLSIVGNVDAGGFTVATTDLTVTVASSLITLKSGSFTLTVAPTGGAVFRGRLAITASAGSGKASLRVDYWMDGQLGSRSASSTTGPTFALAAPATSVTITPTAGSGLRDFDVSTLPYSGLPDLYEYESANTRIEFANAPLTGVFGLAGRTCWDVIQEIAKSTMGAAWIDETGGLVYRSRESLRGGAPVERVNADEQLEDIPWTITDDETADRVVVSYTPATVNTSPTSSLTLWEATSPISVGAGATKTITQDIETASDRVAAFAAIWDDAADPSGLKGSKWAASPNRDGSGAQPAATALTITGKMLTPFKVQLTITNTTNGTLWLVDGNGNPTLIVRTSRQIEAGEAETVEWGASADTAISEFPFDAGQWVQDSTTANEMLTWLVSQFQAQQPTLDQVKVKPDLARQLGDIILLAEEQRTVEHTPLKTKAVVTGITLTGEAGSLEQTLNLALLTDVFRDFDAWCQANSVETFDQLDSALSAANVNTFDDFDRWAATTLVDY